MIDQSYMLPAFMIACAAFLALGVALPKHHRDYIAILAILCSIPFITVFSTGGGVFWGLFGMPLDLLIAGFFGVLIRRLIDQRRPSAPRTSICRSCGYDLIPSPRPVIVILPDEQPQQQPTLPP